MDWDHCYQQGKTPWEKGEPSPPLLAYLKRDALAAASLLVPGCGWGHDVRAIAGFLPETRVVGLDISPTALERARQFPTVGQECYVEEDLFALPASMRGEFDVVWEHTCYCAIDPERRDEYVVAVHGALREKGEFLAIFFLDPYDDDHPSGGPPFGATQEEIRGRFDPFFDWKEDWVPSEAYPGREGREWMARLVKR
ncbi:MAG: methyltransferase [Verrucomicrobiota bacterium]